MAPRDFFEGEMKHSTRAEYMYVWHRDGAEATGMAQRLAHPAKAQ